MTDNYVVGYVTIR